MWNMMQDRFRLFLREEEGKEAETKRARRLSLQIPRKSRFQRSGRILELALAIGILLVAVLCGCCEPFRTWFISVVHALAIYR